MTLPRLLTVALLGLLGCLVAVGLAWRPVTAPPATEARTVAADRVAPLAVLQAWDRDRAAAWRRADPRALARLYVPQSDSGRADRALLTAYAGRGLRVAGLRMQRAAVEVLAADHTRIVLQVTDRLMGATAVSRYGRVDLPRDGWSCRRIVLTKHGGAWVVAEVHRAGGA